MTKTAIRLKTKQQFKDIKEQHNLSWKLYMWNYFKDETCYIPQEKVFISLDRAIEYGHEIQRKRIF